MNFQSALISTNPEGGKLLENPFARISSATSAGFRQGSKNRGGETPYRAWLKLHANLVQLESNLELLVITSIVHARTMNASKVQVSCRPRWYRSRHGVPGIVYVGFKGIKGILFLQKLANAESKPS